ncbi:MAG: magnesium-translocating P-type ATPase [Candidatus Micrarchaeia archaeon]
MNTSGCHFPDKIKIDEAATWSEPIENLYSRLSTSPSGLSSKEARARLKVYGQNAIPEKDRRTAFDVLLSQFASPLLLILIIASVVSAFVGEIFDTLIILVVISVSVVLGFVQEYKSERVLSELKRYFSHRAVVLRDGEKMQIDVRELVPGDVVFVRLGDIIPADLRVIETEGIRVDESVLTGESREVEKTEAPSRSAMSPQDITNGLFMGTTVVDGYARALVVATGKDTFFGRTATIFSSKVPESDFQMNIKRFGNLLLRIIVVLAIFVFLTNFLLGHGEKSPLVESALFALAIAVGITPEALPVIVTVTLSWGSMLLAKKKVVVKKLAAIEDLGDMDVLCTDKTGTLTEESIQMDRYVDLDSKDSHDVFEYAFLCNAAEGTTHLRGSAIDVAIRRSGIASKIDVSRFKKIQEVPFDFTRRRMSQVVSERGRRIIITKGEPESILSVCSKVKMGGRYYDVSEKREYILGMIARYADEGQTTIGVAYREIDEKREYTKEDEHGLIFIGFVLLSNPPKHGVRHTIERLRKLGIRLKVVTGDDPRLTRRLCYQIGFAPAEDRVVTGNEIRNMSEKELAETVERFDVFARVTPEQKLAIVEALRKNGHVVGFLGDGINDAPALRAADVGISVDTAADVAKEASHIILLNKSLGVVCDGVEEGRNIFANITKYLLNTMSANQGNMITVSLSSLFLPFIPLLPVQILLTNMLSDIPLLSISTDNVDRHYTEKPQKWDMNMLLRFMVFFGAISSFFDILFIAILHFVMKVDVDVFRTAWFLLSVLSEMLILFSLRTQLPFFRSMPSRMLIATSLVMMLASVAVVYIAPLSELFHFVPLGVPILALMGAVLIAYFVATEVGKFVFFSCICPSPTPTAKSNK